ncbi:hypothetical protein HGM15179_020417, partial [Zosterops borbonicus]
MEEQLAQGHIEETTSPWNSPVIIIKKPGKNKWRLLHDLREINKVIEDMVPLQLGMPTPTMLPRDWQLAVLDIKDWFFQIPLHPEDVPRFAFSVPSINREAPMKRYHWKVLPQGLKEDKVQRMPPWKYLGLEITARTVVLQKMEIQCNLKTLADLHSLCRSLNWVRPWLGLTNEDLVPLFNLLKGERELVSPRELTPEVKMAIEKVQKALSERQAHQCEPNIPFHFIVLGKLPHLHGLIFQWIEGQRDSLLIIEWVFLSHQRSKTIPEPQELIAQLIRKARVGLCELAGCDFACIHLPVKLSEEGRNSPERLTKEMFEHLLQGNASLQLSLDSYMGQITVHAPSHKSFNEEFHLIPREKRSQRPLKALTVYTDASEASHKSVMMWRNPQTQLWEADVEFVEGSPQVAELAAAAKLSHQQYHQNVPGLLRQFRLRGRQTRAIVATCPNCQLQAIPSMGMGVNPWHLGSSEVWQTDITHIPSFDCLKYVHVSIDTYSGAVYASAHAGEKSAHVKQHPVQAFSVLGISKEIKTDNVSAYVSKEFLEFIQQWGVECKTGIPYSPTGQAVVERAHQTLKQVLARQSSSTVWMSPQQKLCKALFTINFLNCSFENESTSEKTYLTLNPVMNPIQVATFLMLNNLVTPWIMPQPHQNVCVTLAQTLQQENICLSTAAAENPMSTCL